MERKDTKSLPPSLAIGVLKPLIGKRVTKMIRYSWWPKEEVSSECAIANNLAFSKTQGPLGIEFEDGSMIGVGVQPSLYSVVVWLDRLRGDQVRHPALDEDTELFPIDAADPEFSDTYFKAIIGSTLAGLSVLKPSSLDVRLEQLPCEVGLSFLFEGGKRLIAFRDDGDDFFALRDEQLEPQKRAKIVEIALL
jgi:hypothetical protein